MISDPKGRPVYAQSETTLHGHRSFRVWARNEKTGEYSAVDDTFYGSVEDILADYPNAVKLVNRRETPAKKRHPAVHYKPTRRGIACWKYARERSSLTDELYGNAKVTTDLDCVTCRECLEVAAAIAARKLG
jgi:hypothetical protein